MNNKNNTLTLDEWKDLERQISELLDLTWNCAQAKAERETLDLRRWYIERVEAFIATGETYTELDDKLKQVAKQLNPPLDKHTIWRGIKPHIETKLKETQEQVFKTHRREGFDRVAKILLYMEKLGLPEEAREATPKWLEKLK